MNGIIGLFVIGFTTAQAGYPIFTEKGFSFDNFFVLCGCIILWSIIMHEINNKNNS